MSGCGCEKKCQQCKNNNYEKCTKCMSAFKKSVKKSKKSKSKKSVKKSKSKKCVKKSKKL
jgi:hypothetical protein